MTKIVLNTPGNVDYLTKKFGKPQYDIAIECYYLKVDLLNNEWRYTFDYEWLYMPEPELTNIEEI